MQKLKQKLFLEMFTWMMLSFLCTVLCAGERDPFYLNQTKKTIEKAENIKLLGIIEGSEKSCAFFDIDGCEETVFVGDVISGFKVKQIRSTQVILTKGKKNKKIFIDQ